jgi:hypothetical protein
MSSNTNWALRYAGRLLAHPTDDDSTGSLRAAIVAASGDLAVTVSGECPRCGHEVESSTAVTDVEASQLRDDHVSVLMHCRCRHPHDGRPSGTNSGCGLSFSVDVRSDLLSDEFADNRKREIDQRQSDLVVMEIGRHEAALSGVHPESSVRVTAPLLTLRFSDGRTVQIEGTTVLGRRSPAGHGQRTAFVEIDDPAVSSNHAELRPDGADFVVVDLGSSNGTVVILPGGSELNLRPGQLTRIVAGSRLLLAGSTQISVEALNADGSSPPYVPGFSYRSVLGKGGAADVYLYEQAFPRRLVAMKVTRADIPQATKDMLVREASVMALLNHPNINSVIAAGKAADGRPYLVSEYHPNASLYAHSDSRMPVSTVLEIGVRVAGAVAATHRVGIIHRDIKPQNILINAYGQPANVVPA